MDLYSFLLATSILTVGVGLLATTTHLLRRPQFCPCPCSQVARGAVLFTLLLVSLATGLHLIHGYRLRTEDALGLVAFLAAHRAVVVLAAMADVILWLVRGRGT